VYSAEDALRIIRGFDVNSGDGDGDDGGWMNEIVNGCGARDDDVKTSTENEDVILVSPTQTSSGHAVVSLPPALGAPSLLFPPFGHLSSQRSYLGPCGP
jgi:hypothetical protein